MCARAMCIAFSLLCIGKYLLARTWDAWQVTAAVIYGCTAKKPGSLVTVRCEFCFTGYTLLFTH